jgi:hypothetical protein
MLCPANMLGYLPTMNAESQAWFAFVAAASPFRRAPLFFAQRGDTQPKNDFTAITSNGVIPNQVAPFAA